VNGKLRDILNLPLHGIGTSCIDAAFNVVSDSSVRHSSDNCVVTFTTTTLTPTAPPPPAVLTSLFASPLDLQQNMADWSQWQLAGLPGQMSTHIVAAALASQSAPPPPQPVLNPKKLI
jgi:hypothetical protein